MEKILTKNDEEKSVNTNQHSNIDIIYDTDDDNIPDLWEINGYTIQDSKIVAWDDKKHKNKGYTKYFSDPDDQYTCGDPYTDYEKIMGLIDGLEEAKNPLVAAFPQIGVELEKIVLSKKSEILNSISEGKNIKNESNIGNERTNANSSSNSISIEASASAEISAFKGPSAEISVSGSISNGSSSTYSLQLSNSNTKSIEQEKQITKKLSIKKADAANLNANIRYINTGTASIYNLKPTLNFVLVSDDNENKTISTIVSKDNNFANCLLPNAKYPELLQNPISFSANDDFNAHPITLNYDQLSFLENNGKLQLEVTQFNGIYKKYNEKKEKVISNYFDWNVFLPKIYNKTALISFAFKDNEILHRRVAANKFNSNERKIPQLTIKEAIEIAFKDISFNSNIIVYKRRKIDLSNFDIIIDQKTKEVLNSQIKENSEINFASIINTKLTQEMKIYFVEKRGKILPPRKRNDSNFYSEAYKFFGYSGISTDLLLSDAKLIYDEYYKNPFDVNYEINYTQFKDLIFLKKYLQEKFNDHMAKLGYNQKAIIEIDNNAFKGNDLIKQTDQKGYYIESPDKINYQFNIRFSFHESQPWLHIYFKNIAFSKNSEKSIMLKQLNEFLSKDGGITCVINGKNALYRDTDFNNSFNILKEITKSYLFTKFNVNEKLLEEISIEFLELINLKTGAKEITNNLNDIISDHLNAGSNFIDFSTKLKYFNEWESEKFMVRFTNFGYEKPAPNLNSYKITFENWFKNEFINALDKDKALNELAKLFFNNFE